MSDIQISKQQLSDRMHNIVNVLISVEGGNWRDEEYKVYIEGFCGSLILDAPGGEDDPYLILDAIRNNSDEVFKGVPDNAEMFIQLVLEESGEWQDVFWCKWYDVIKIVRG